MKSKFYKLERLLNLLSFKLDHKDYVASFSLIYDLELGDTSKEEMLEIFKKVAHSGNVIRSTFFLAAIYIKGIIFFRVFFSSS